MLAAVAGLAFFSYRIGAELAALDVARLQREVQGLSQRLDAVQQANAQLAAEARAAREAAVGWQTRFEREVPTGISKELHALIASRLEEGVEPARIAFMIRAATNTPQCAGQPETKRFYVRTPLYQGGAGAVSFAANAVTVTAEGEPATDAAGNIEAWFDPAKPVTVRFTQLGGDTSSVEGVLPLHHSLVRGGSEYKFSVLAADQRGFVNATAESCRLP